MRLRDDLRRDTRETHLAVERQFEATDIRTRSGLQRFVLAHHAAVLPIERHLAAAGPPWSGCWPFQLIQLLRDDLQAMALTPHDVAATPGLDDAHPLGLCYVLGGSRLGARVLGRRLSDGDRWRMPARSHWTPGYLTRAPDDEIWSWTLALLGSPEAELAPRAEILSSARIAFTCFADALAQIGEPQESIDEFAV
ncbi:MAG: biliverdin-producing heme oxygenase [Thalassobaculaceae bacterium]|nr:biliverdin-producing heme oxygenase [Thalassobaculaceae bacterium]